MSGMPERVCRSLFAMIYQISKCIKICRRHILLRNNQQRGKGERSMKEFAYEIQDEVGIHARPAGQLAKKAAEFKSAVSIVKDGKKADTRRLMALMGLGIKCGDSITVQVEGEDEDAAAEAIRQFLTENHF